MVGHPISNDDFIMNLLQGVSLEYDIVIANTNLILISLDIEDILALLLSQEMRIQSMNSEMIPSTYVVEKTRKNDKETNHEADSSREGSSFYGKDKKRSWIWFKDILLVMSNP